MLDAIDRALTIIGDAMLYSLASVLFAFLIGGALTVFIGLPFELAFYICIGACAAFAAYFVYLEKRD